MALGNKEKAVYELVINGELAGRTLKELTNDAKTLATAFRNTANPEDQKKLAEAYQKVTERIEQQRNALTGNKKAAESYRDSLKEIGAAVGIAFSLDLIKSFFAESIQAFAASEKAGVQLKNQLLIVNGETSKMVKVLVDQQDELSGMFDDDAIRDVQLYFAQYGFGAETIKNTVPVVRDFAAATGQSMQDAAAKVIQAANGQSKSLKEYGIQVEDTGSKMKNLEFAIEALNKKFQGQADLLEETTYGTLERLKNQWDDFLKEVGNKSLQAFSGVRSIFLRVFDPAQAGIEKMKEDLAKQADAVNQYLEGLDDSALQKKLKNDQLLYQKQLQQKNDLKQQEESDANKAQLDRLNRELVYFELTMRLTQQAIEKRKQKPDNADDLTAGGMAARQKAQDELIKFRQVTNQLYQQLSEEQTAIVEDKYNKELDALEQKHKKEIAELEKQKVVKKNLTADELQRNEVVNQLIAQRQEKFLRDRSALEQQVREQLIKDELAQDLANLDEWNNQQKAVLADQRAQGRIDEDQYQTALKKLQLQYLTLKLQNLKDYGQSTTAVEAQISQTIISLEETKAKELEEQFKDSLGKLSDEGKKQAAALIQELSVLMVTGTSVTGKSIEEILAQLESLMKGGASDPEKWKTTLNQIADHAQFFASQISSAYRSINTIADNNDKKRLASAKASMDKEKAEYDILLQKKLISKSEYDRKLSDIEANYQRQQRKAARDSAVRHQRASIFEAVTNTAVAVTKTYAQFGWPLGAILGAIMLATAGLQIAAIKSEPLPELGTGGILKGAKHNSPSRGMTVLGDDGKPVMKLEGGELVGSARFVEQNPELAQRIVEASKTDGTLDLSDMVPDEDIQSFPVPSFGTGIRPSVPQINTPRIISTSNIQASSSGTDSSVLSSAIADLTALLSKLDTSISEHSVAVNKSNNTTEKLMKEGLKSKIVYREFKDELNRLEGLTGRG